MIEEKNLLFVQNCLKFDTTVSMQHVSTLTSFLLLNYFNNLFTFCFS